jgi:hypothetical protein
MRIIYVLGILGFLAFIPSAYAQTINVTQATPCFLNETAGARVWENCNFDDDWLTGIMLPWQWITGGNFSMIFVSVLILFSYIKYHKMIYSVMVGAILLPTTYMFFPAPFISTAVILAFVGIGLTVAFIYLKQTKEY